MPRHIFAAALCAAAIPASASTLDFGNGSFDATARSWTFDNVASLGGNNVDMVVTTSPPLDSANDTPNQTFEADVFRANLRTEAGNASRFTFAFLDDLGNSVTLPALTIGVFDLDYDRGEILEVFGAQSYTTIAPPSSGGLDITTSPGSVRVKSVATVGVPNPTDLNALTVAQQQAAIQFSFGDVSSFDVIASIGLPESIAPQPSNTGRNFFFGNLAFDEPTTTTPVPPVPVPPAMALMVGGLAVLGGLRARASRRATG